MSTAKSCMAAAALVVLGACAPRTPAGTSPAPQPASPSPSRPSTISSSALRATTTLLDGSGTKVGTATLTEMPSGVMISLTVTGLGIGSHGAHLHTVGVCTAPTFASAGGHFNPRGKAHGFANPDGHHTGDLPNVISPPAGAHTVQYFIEDLKLTGRGGLLDDDGAALIVHSSADDYQTDPAGDSGARAACGVIAIVR
jgi:superoxide dismutase, Cu-Zn family